ncbi:MAG: TIGR01906 family membrane protein [Clostridiales bacterium]|nr:TIGR01906 family membrane protein [Clostridiales bacterium]
MRKRTLTPGNLLLALIGFLFLASLSVVLVLNLRCIYYFDISYLNLESETGYSEELIRENYDTLIDYNLLWKGVNELEFPDFPMSDQGETHFKEVKRIFVAIQCLCVVTGLFFLISLCKKLRRKDYGSLKLLSVLTFLIPAVLGICAAVNWEAFFVRFHELFFNNDYWLFDPIMDPVILILPDEFFAHCAAAILLLLLLSGVLTGGLYRLLTGKYRRNGVSRE